MTQPLTPLEWLTLIAYARHEDQTVAAHELGIGVHRMKNRLSRIYLKLDAHTSIGAFKAVGWLTLPGDQTRTPDSIGSSGARSPAAVTPASSRDVA